MKKILIFENLNIFNLIFLVFFKLFFKEIYFFNLKNYFKNKYIEKFLVIIGIYQLGFKNLDCKFHNRRFEIGKNLQMDLMNKYAVNNFLFKAFENYYGVNIEKFKLCLRGEIFHLSDEAGTLILIEKKFPLEKNIIYYIPFTISSYLLLKKYHKNLKVFSLTIIFKIVFLILEKFLNLFKKYINIKKFTQNKKKNDLTKKDINVEDFEIAFFPHKSLKYGNSYSKTLIFSEVLDQKTFKSKILSIARESLDKFTVRYFKFYNIQNIDINSLNFGFDVKKLFYLFNNFNFLQKFSIFRIILSYFILITIFQIEKNLNIFSKLKKLKLIYCDYDVLFSKTILLACDIKKIKTISNQERYLTNNLMPPLFFNYYLVTGNKYEEMFKTSGYLVDKYFVTGTLRNSKNLNIQKLEIKKEIIRLKKIKKKKILCIGTSIQDKYNTMLVGENGTSIENNINFLKQIINLAKNFENLHFIIRYKIDMNYNLLPNQLFESIENIENIEFNRVDSKINIYELLHLSSFVIGRYSSLIEESLSDGINAIIYDECNFFSTISKYHPVSKILTAKNEEELTNYLNIYLEGRDLYDDNFKKEIKNSFSDNLINKNSKFKVQKILNELI